MTEWGRDNDMLIAEKAEGLRVFFDGRRFMVSGDRDRFGPGLKVDDAAYLPHYDRNLQRVMDAAMAYCKRTGVDAGIHIRKLISARVGWSISEGSLPAAAMADALYRHIAERADE